MEEAKRQGIIAGNWKMYKTIQEAVEFVEKLAPEVSQEDLLVYLAVPFTAIQPAAEAAKETNLVIGAQNMNDATEGAFTGEIAASMLKNAGAQFVLLGHSERRHLFHEDNAFINRKVHRALQEGLQPILCIGETATEREATETEAVLRQQITESLASITEEDLLKIVIAYEPVWAIGTGQSATPAQAEEAQHFCRSLLAEIWSEAVAEKIPLLYGGSVKKDNAKELLGKPNIDGALVGGASLEVESFAKIVHDGLPYEVTLKD